MRRIRLGNTVFEGRNDAYLFDDGAGPTTLVDTGVATPDAREQLRAGLAEDDLSFADVDAVLLTHWHHDHAGLAGEIQAEGGATVYVHEADAPMVTEDSMDHEAEIEERDLFEKWGVPDGKARELLDFFDLHDRIRGRSPTVETFTDGATFDLGSVELEAVHLPGHAAGLTGFAFESESANADADEDGAANDGHEGAGDEGDGGRDDESDGDDGASNDESDGGRELLAGDALLPKYTPNVGGADPRVEHPLGAYLDSLDRIVEGDYARAWPGHRDPIDDPTERAREIVAHHRERTERVVSVLRERGGADAWTVSADLFGELSRIHILHGPGEAWAHLDHLERHDVAERTDGEYALRDESPDLDATFDDGGGRHQEPASNPSGED